MTETKRHNYRVLYRPTGEWMQFELCAANIEAAMKESESRAPRGYTLSRIDEFHDGEHYAGIYDG